MPIVATTTTRAGGSDDTLSALDRLVPGTASSPDADADADADAAADDAAVPAASLAVTREVLVELEYPDNVAEATIDVASASARVTQVRLSPPLGIVFEESGDGDVVVAEVLPDGNAASLDPREGAVVRPGDVLRACSAMVPEMKYGAGGLMLGGNGRPGFRRVLFLVARGERYEPVRSFDQAMKAIVSNQKAGDFDVNLVFERRASESR